MTHFADRLAALVEERRSRVVLGLDPDPTRLWPSAVQAVEAEWEQGSDPEDVATLEALGQLMPDARASSKTDFAVRRHCREVIEAAGVACVAVKLQLAWFERLGAGGSVALTEVILAARHHGLLVLLDGKRGDVPVSARAYAQAMVGKSPGPFGDFGGFEADAFTASPLLGRDSLEPLVDAATEAGAGVFVLVRTSNPGAADVQDLEVDGAPLWERLATMVNELGETGDSGLSNVGAVTGATRPEHLARMRELMPRAVFLLPGVGAQGGRVEDLGPAFEPHPAAGLITASRSIVDAHAERGGGPAESAAVAAEELRAAAAKL